MYRVCPNKIARYKRSLILQRLILSSQIFYINIKSLIIKLQNFARNSNCMFLDVWNQMGCVELLFYLIQPVFYYSPWLWKLIYIYISRDFNLSTLETWPSRWFIYDRSKSRDFNILKSTCSVYRYSRYVYLVVGTYIIMYINCKTHSFSQCDNVTNVNEKRTYFTLLSPLHFTSACIYIR